MLEYVTNKTAKKKKKSTSGRLIFDGAYVLCQDIARNRATVKGHKGSEAEVFGFRPSAIA